MKDRAKTKLQLIKELEEMRQRLSELKKEESLRNQMEAACRESEARLQALIDSFPFEFWAMDKHLRYILQNSVNLENHGDVIGKKIDDLEIPLRTKKHWVEQNMRVLRGEILHEEYDNIVAGETRVYENHVAPVVVDKDIIGIVGVALDITERKQKEKMLEEMRRQQEALLNNIPDIAWMKDKEGKFIAVNEPFGKSCGFKPECLVGKTDLDIWPKDLAERYRSDDREVVESGIRKLVEEPLIDSEGRALWIETVKTPIYNGNGEVTGSVGIARDVTKRKQAEEALRESEERYRRMTRCIPDAVWAMDLSGRFTYVNSALERMHGWAAEEALERNFRDLVAPEQVAKDEAIIEDAFAKAALPQYNRNTVYSFESQELRKDGSTFSADVSASFLWSENGRPIGIIGITRDVTERKRAEDTLRASEEMYRRLVETANEAIYVVQDGMLKFVNPITVEITGYSEQELTSTPFSEFVHPDDRDMAVERNLRRLKGEAVPDRNQCRIIARNGSIKWTEISGVLIEWEGKPATLNLSTDITERKRVEDSIRESETKFRALADSSPSAIFLVQGTRFVYVNPAFSSIMGYAIDDLVKTDFWNVVHPTSRELVKKRGLARMRGEGPLPRYEIKVLTKGGRKKWVDYSASVIEVDNKPTIVGSAFDITEQKRAEQQLRVRHEELSAAYEQLAAYDKELAQNYRELSESQRALRESEERYRNMFENALEGIYQSTPEGAFINVNPAMARMCGYSSPAEMVASITDIPTQYYVDYRDRERFISLLNANGRIDSIEFRVRRKDGSEIWISVSARVVTNDHGDILYYEGGAQDITEGKRAEDTLRASEEKFFKAFQASLGLMAIRSLEDGRLIDVNDAFINTTGYSREELIGRNPIMLGITDSETIERIKKMISEQGFVRNLEGEFKTKTGDIRTGLFSATAVNIGDEPCFISAIHDITERKAAERALEAERERLTSILDGIPIPAFMIDRKHNVVLWNRHNETYTGITKDNIFGKRVELNPLFQDKPSLILAELVLEMADGELMAKFGKSGLRESHVQPHAFESTGRIWIKGKERILNVQAARITDPKGNIVGAVQTAQDITDRAKLELQLRQAQKMEAIGTLAGGIAHDFNNILSAVLGYTEMALEDPKLNDRLRRCLVQVYTAGERARDLVKQILSFSRQSDERARPLRVSPIIKEVLKLLRASLPTTIKMRQDIQPEPDAVLADPTQIHQILMNLCTNAAHAMRGRQGELKVSLVPVNVEPPDDLIIHHDLSTGKYLRLTVSDTGAGIDKEIMHRIFDPFFTTKELGEGTGLGLSVVYGIVRSCGGAITVQSQVGKGTEFNVYLPLLTEIEGKQKAKVEASIPGGKECILFVDDEAALVQLATSTLSGLGYEVVGRTSSLEALELFRTRPDRFDLVITDMTMPNMTGSDLAQQLMQLRPDIPIILCTGFSEAITPEKAKALGLRELIMKPIIKNQIAEAIRRVLDEKE